ncbi:MAG: ZIP family metal transporter [Candidatus Omnitrophica bacterium]|nr:ZIP family metal transporter [Candidatus Omnitrophota bacterium]
MTFLYIIASTVIISLASLVGICFISIKENTLQKILLGLVTFATGVLLGGAVLHLVPEAIELGANAPLWILAGILLFFILEKFLFWRHCHDGICKEHPVRYLNLIGDGVHNFIDGTIIAAAFIADVKLGMTTSIIALAHEIPQEIGDFGILVYGGFTKTKALLFNLLSALTCILGGILSYFFATRINNLTPILIALAAGNFLYMALVDLMPEFKKTPTAGGAFLQFSLLCAGILMMWFLKIAH